MSREAEQVIAAVIRNAVAKAEGDAYLHGAWNSRPEIDPEETAAEVVAALGGLTREVSQATRNCSYPGSDGPCVGKHHGRWVSGWTRQEPLSASLPSPGGTHTNPTDSGAPRAAGAAETTQGQQP